MLNNRPVRLIPLVVLLAVSMACQAITGLPAPIAAPTATPTAAPTVPPTPLPAAPVQPGEANPDEPVFITGDIVYTSPFFVNTLSEPFVLLEDQSGFIARDEEFIFTPEGQAIGPVVLHDDDSLTYSLALPAVPQGLMHDLDNDGQSERGVQVFAVAYWSNTWGGPFLEERDGTGWSSAYASTITDPERDSEITGGTLVVWAPDEEQSFPSGFGEDGSLFTEDDPAVPLAAGYSVVDLSVEPFRVSKEARPRIDLIEGDIAVNDFSSLSYGEAFEAMFEKVSVEYPFTDEKGVDWQTLHDTYGPQAAAANDDDDFYRALRDFTWQIPDAHVGLSVNGQVFYEERGGGLGLILAELGDGTLVATRVFPGGAAEKAGIETGAVIETWDGKPAGEALRAVTPYLGPYSTEHHRRLEQAAFLTRMPPGDEVKVGFTNPGGSLESETLESDVEYESLFASIPSLSADALRPPVEAWSLPGEGDQPGIAYIRVNTFSDDYSLMARLWERSIQAAIDAEVPGMILDIRTNGGGSAGLALEFAGYFFEEPLDLYHSEYYNELLGDFKPVDHISRIEPGPVQYEGPLAVLVGPYCVSACESFAYALSQDDRATLVGHFPTAGAYGEVGRGQYKLPGDISMQFPTGRSLDMDGKRLIEGVGVIPDVTVAVTLESALGQVDAVLEAAVEVLRK